MARYVLSLFLLLWSASALAAQISVQGDFEFDSLTVSCPAAPAGCYTCVNDLDTTGDHRLMLALGATYPNLVTTGEAEGVLRPHLEVDGIHLPPDLFPCGAVIRAGVKWFDRPFARACGETPVSVTYQIGSDPEVTVSGDGEAQFVIPASEAHEIPFRFSLCSEYVYWGAGCGVAGSSMHGFKMDMLGHLDAVAVEAGDSPAVSVPTSGFAIDVASGPGGAISISRVQGDAPGVPAVPHLNGYWDVHTDMERGSFVADVTLALDAASFPAHVNPAAVVIGVYDPLAGAWRPLTTDVDVAAGTATITTDLLSKFALVESAAVTTLATTWGALKATW